MIRITIIPIRVVSIRREQVVNREIFNLLSGFTYFPYNRNRKHLLLCYIETMPVGLVNNATFLHPNGLLIRLNKHGTNTNLDLDPRFSLSIDT